MVSDSPLDYNNFTGNVYWRYWSANNSAFNETLSTGNTIYSTPYQSTQIGNRSIRWLESIFDEWSDDGNYLKEDVRPLFAYIGPHAPHFPAQPAPWYELENFYKMMSLKMDIILDEKRSIINFIS